MKKRTTAQALGFSVLSLLLCVSMLIGTTFAWFTDSVSSARNTIQSGNLDVALYYLDDNDDWMPVNELTDIFGYNLWEPGYTKVAYFKVVNEGSLALNYQLSADVYAETKGINKAGDSFSLSDYIKTSVVEQGVSRDDILAMSGNNLKGALNMSVGSLEAKNDGDSDEKIVGFALWMPTTVTNEANHNGTNVPSIEFGINLVATQKMKEIDSFGNNYDKDAAMPFSGTGTALVDGSASYEIPIKRAGESGGKIGSAIVQDDSIADDATHIEVTIDQRDSVLDGFTVATDEGAVTYDIEVTGIKDDNIVPLKVEFHVGTGLTGVKLYHFDGVNNVEVTDAVYNATTGNIIFESTNFSPFTLVYDAVATEPDGTEVPEAEVIPMPEHVGVDIDGLGYQLETAYSFKSNQSVEEVENSIYKDWHCDFYVSLTRDLIAGDAPVIYLAGNYGSYGWLGFDDTEVTLTAGEELPLLGSVTKNPWTYGMVAGLVGEFICGVADIDDALAGETFTVKLRLTNPADETDIIDVATIPYTFTGTAGNTTYVDNGEDLQDAINNAEDGDTITLTDDIDLSQGLVIPGNN
ncbi:MAG: hypothetical protein E7588_05865 [Ruminococcaceae bacterium]|nr:hypothetical protein [Oscillospiraceae bacterium]